MRRYVAVKPTNKAGVPSWRSQWSEASHPRGNRAVPHVPDSVPDFARPRDESVTAAGRLADLLTSCAAARPKGGAGCVSAHVRICPGPPGKPGGYRDGVPVCVLEDQHQFILRHYVQHEGGDQDMIVPFLAEAKRRYPALASCSMDKGFYTPENREQLDKLLDLNVMPRKGRHRKADRERETHPDFVAARRQHPVVESAINNLDHRGMSLVRTHGKAGFDRTLALVVVATNVHRIGQVLKQKEARRRKWHQARSRAQ